MSYPFDNKKWIPLLYDSEKGVWSENPSINLNDTDTSTRPQSGRILHSGASVPYELDAHELSQSRLRSGESRFAEPFKRGHFVYRALESADCSYNDELRSNRPASGNSFFNFSSTDSKFTTALDDYDLQARWSVSPATTNPRSQVPSSLAVGKAWSGKENVNNGNQRLSMKELQPRRPRPPLETLYSNSLHARHDLQNQNAAVIAPPFRGPMPRLEAAPPLRMEWVGVARAKPQPATITPPRASYDMEHSLCHDFANVLRIGLKESPKKMEPTVTPYLKLPRAVPEEQLSVTESPKELADYTRILRSLAAAANPMAAAKSEATLRDMIASYNSGSSGVRPDGACFNAVIHTYAQLGNAERAEAVLLLMFQDFESGNPLAEPNVRVYTNVLHAWRKSKLPEAPERCERILEQMHRLHESGVLPDCRPDVFSYTVLFHLLGEIDRQDAAEKALNLFHKMKDRADKGDDALRPDVICYSNILNIFTKVGAKNEQAEDVLWMLVNDYLNGNQKAEPRIRNFNTVLAMWSKSSARDAPDRAQAIVDRVRALNKKGTLKCKPDQYTYSLLLKAWTSSKRKGALERAVSCLYWMQDLHRSGDEAACLDVVKYTTVIGALVRSGEVKKADALLNKMTKDFLDGNEKAMPDAKIYEAVISAWVDLKDEDNMDVVRAESLLRRMWQLNDSNSLSDIRPSAHIYGRIIVAAKKTNNPVRAETMLFEMDRIHKSGDLDEGPTLRLFQTVFNAWKNSRLPQKHTHMGDLQVEMNARFPGGSHVDSG